MTIQKECGYKNCDITIEEQSGIVCQSVRLTLDVRKIKYHLQKSKNKNEVPTVSGIKLHIDDGNRVWESIPKTLQMLGKMTDLYPEDKKKRNKVDFILKLLDKLRKEAYIVHEEKNKVTRKELLQNYINETIPKIYDEIEEYLVSNCKSKSSQGFEQSPTATVELEAIFSVGKELSVADIDLACVSRWLLAGYVESIPGDILAPYMCIGKITRYVFGLVSEGINDTRIVADRATLIADAKRALFKSKSTSQIFGSRNSFSPRSRSTTFSERKTNILEREKKAMHMFGNKKSSLRTARAKDSHHYTMADSVNFQLTKFKTKIDDQIPIKQDLKGIKKQISYSSEEENINRPDDCYYLLPLSTRRYVVAKEIIESSHDFPVAIEAGLGLAPV